MSKKNPLFLLLAISAVFFVIFVIIAVGTVISMTSGSSTGQARLFFKSSNLGVIEVNGIIMDSKKTLEQIDKFSDDPLIRGVIIRLNSPGGAVGPSQEIYEACRRLAKKKPVFASMGSTAASGAYYIAVGTKRIFANPGTITGSIGVIMQFADLSRLYEWAKVNPYVIKTGRFKDIGSTLKEMGPEEKQLLREMADNVLSQFRKAVAEGRQIPMARVVEVSDGRILSGEQAKEAKLIDELGGLNEAAEALAREVGIAGKPKLVYATKKKRLLERILEDETESGGSESRFVDGIVRAVLRALGASVSVPVPSPGAGPLFLMPHVWN